jgi:hypothetical protein
VAGGLPWARAKGVINSGDLCEIADNTGRIRTAQAECVVEAGLVPAANVATLAQVARNLVSANATAGTSAGPKTILPKGTAPAAGQCSLKADGTGVTFAAADAVTAATIEYIAPRNIVCEAQGTSAADDDLIPVLPVRARQG